MRSGKAIAIWYSEEDRRRVQEAATLTGYRQVSKYIRDRSLGRDTAGANLQLQLDRQRLQDQLETLARQQKTTEALLAMVLYLVRKKATSGDLSELLAQVTLFPNVEDVVKVASPELAGLLDKLVGG